MRAAVLLALCFLAVASAQSFEFDVAKATKDCKSHFYRDAAGKPSTSPIVMRIGCKFTATVRASVPTVAITGFLARLKFGESPMGITSKTTKTSEGVFSVEVTLGDVSNMGTAIGAYSLYLVDGAGKQLFKYPTTLQLTFNPYVQGSPSYIADEPSRVDWIENEAGAMWVGSGDKPQWSPWTFDQFDNNVWTVVFKLVESLTPAVARDPTQVVRLLAGMISTKVLIGRWGDGPWTDADTVPWQWSSSKAIYKVVAANNRPAKYGQCMIFSMVTASAIRTIGIAGQSHTGYDFVQEKGGDLTVRVYWKPDGKGGYVWDTAANDKNGEKLWNFHAWSVAHISRPDLKSTEVTPNIVDGTWHAGPGRISDFKAGALTVPFDLGAYNPSINSRVIYLNQDAKNPAKYLEWKDPFVPANKIYTTQVQRPGGCSRKTDAQGAYTSICWDDAVMMYKSKLIPAQSRPVSSPSFRQISAGMRQKNRVQLTQGQRQRAASNGVQFVSYMPLSTRLGNEMNVALTPVGKPTAAQIGKVYGIVSLQTYDGTILSQIKSDSGSVGGLRMTVNTADFGRVPKKHIAASTFIVAHFSVYDAAGKLTLFEERKMAIEPPQLNMLCGRKTIAVGKKISCNINFYNPMPFPITATLDLTVSGQADDRTFQPKTIVIPAKAGTDPQKYRGFFESIKFTTTTPGEQMIVASLKTDALNEIKGAAQITVLAQ